MTDDLLASLKVTVAAALGGAVGLRAVPAATRWQALANWGSGFAIAFFVAPAVADYMRITSIREVCGIAFVLGAGGLVAFGALIDAVKAMPLAAIVSGWLSRPKLPKDS